jgi:tetratricopeptide (TPR) repeat protein/tRNA A-37 threonylcarbamoyl transferase component Bud32
VARLEGQTLLRRYRVEAFIGRGGMAEVYKAYDTRRGYDVAIKVMREDLAEDREFVNRFRREARNLSKLSHENIVRFYGFEQQGQLAFLVMDYVQGSTLRSLIADAKGPLPLPQALSIFRQICQALHYAHEEGIIHRDIKPGNIIVRPNGRVLISDFGIAKVADASTQTTFMPGTPAYMSPEQCRSEPVDRRTDIYSLGIVLFEMLTGRRPFIGETGAMPDHGTRERIRWEQMNLMPPSPRQFNPALSEMVERGVLKALAKNANERFPSALAFLAAIPEAEGAAPVALAPIRPLVEGEAAAQRLYAQAEAAMVAAEWGQAIDLLNRILALHGPFRDTVEKLTEANRQRHLAELWRQAQIAYEAEEWTEAIALCADIIALAPGYPGVNTLLREATRGQRLAALYQEGTQAMSSGRWAEAIDKLSQIVEAEPEYRDAAALLAQARQTKAHQDRVAELRQQGAAALEGERWREAIAAFSELVALEPEDEDAASSLARAQAGFAARVAALWEESQAAQTDKRWRDAILFLEELVALEPEGRGYQEALDVARAALAREEHLAAAYARGVEALGTENWQAAIEALAEVAVLEPDYADAADLLKFAQAGLERQEKLASLLALTRERIEKEDWEEAIAAIKEALELAPDLIQGRALLYQAEEGARQARIRRLWDGAEAAMAAGMWAEAIEKLQEALTLAPEDASLIRGLQVAEAGAARQARIENLLAEANAAWEAEDWAIAADRYGELSKLIPEEQIYRTRRDEAAHQAERQARIKALAAEARAAWDIEDWVTAAEKYGELSRLVPEEIAYRTLRDEAAYQADRQIKIEQLELEAARTAQAGNWDEAVATYERLTALAPQEKIYLARLEETREKATRQAQIEALSAQAGSACRDGDWQTAIAALEKLVEITPDEPVYEERLADVRARAERAARAARLENRAAAAYEAGKWTEAIDIYTQLTELVPDNEDYQARLNEARTAIERQKTLASQLAVAWERLAIQDWQGAIAMASQALEVMPESAEAQSVLDEAQAGLGQAKAMRELASGRPLRTIQGHTDSVLAVAFSPDGAFLASGGDDRTICLWDVASGELLQILGGHKGPVYSVALTRFEGRASAETESTGGVLLASASKDRTVRLWLLGLSSAGGVTSGEILHVLEGHESFVRSVAFSPDGMLLASAGGDGTVRLWDPLKGKMLRTLKGHKDSVYSVAFSPDAKLLASGGDDRTVRLWDVVTGKESHVLKGHTDAVYSVAFAPDGTLLASGSKDKTIRLWGAASGEALRTLEGHADLVFSVAFNPDGTLLASGSWDGAIRLWEVASSKTLRTLSGHRDWVSSVTFLTRPTPAMQAQVAAWTGSSSGVLLASGSWDRTVRLWGVAP